MFLYSKNFLSSKNRLLKPSRVPLLLSCGVCCSGKQIWGAPPAGAIMEQRVRWRGGGVLTERMRSTARRSEFEGSFLHLLAVWL